MNITMPNQIGEMMLPKDMVMATVAEVKGAFMAFKPGPPARIDASAVERIDLVGMQLMLAFLRADAPGPAPRLSSFSPKVAETFARAGVPLPETH